ncbi:MAG: Na+/H+ antiporter NhaC family protein [Aminobacterium sp.]|uniref:Na+/H+ antiporter NhaC family protein n=1 Tax=Aminobacterium sp. TaxID=1872491 RepID=UPI001BCD102C|nr:Na+/H+ antiporter NhaC family protein [Aminobacterium sp.]MEA4877574.1 Na+/H+ antiporter NhaC family protein [Aminobacterium sp.]
MEQKVEQKTKRKISFPEAVGLLFCFVAILMWSVLKAKIPTGMAILLCTVLASTYGMFILRFSWDDILKRILHVFEVGMPAIFILLMVGLIIASWLASGTTPILILWGLKILNPSIFLVSAFLITGIVSMATGSSWTIVSTFGVALIGIAQGLGIPAGLAGGAIVAGSFLGDKWSPLSDSCNLAAAVTGQDVFKLFKSMFSTSGVAVGLAVIIYAVLGMRYSGGAIDYSIVNTVTEGITNQYTMNVILITPILVVLILAILRKPILPVLILGVALGAILAVFIQGMTLPQVFKVLYSGYKSTSGIAFLDKLLSGGGLSSMMGLTLIIFCAFSFAGAVEEIGVLDILIEKLGKLTSSSGPLVTTSLFTTILTVYLSSSVYVAMILNGRMYSPAYRRIGLGDINVSRTIIESACYSGAYVPWSGGHLVITAALGLTWKEFAPYLFNHWITLILVVFFAFTGRFMEKTERASSSVSLEEDHAVTA